MRTCKKPHTNYDKVLPTSTGEKKKLVVLLFELPVENSKHLNFNLNGGEARWGVDCFALKLPYLSTMSQ